MDLLPSGAADAMKNPLSYFNSIAVNGLKPLFSNPIIEDHRDEGIIFAAVSLHLFIIDNFTGPSIREKLDAGIMDEIRNCLPANYIRDLNLNGEELHTQTTVRELIWIAFNFFNAYNAPDLWKARAALILQRCLSGPSEVLKNIIIPNLTGIELAIAYRVYEDFPHFFEALENHRKDIKFEFELTGRLGKKTKFQQDSKAQLMLDVKDSAFIRGELEAEDIKVTEMSTNEREIKLDAEANILERPKMDDEFTVPPLTNDELAFLLQEARAIGDRAAGYEIRDEKRIPILTHILEVKPKYAIATCALFDKSILEQRAHSTQPRAALQLQSIIDDFEKEDPPALDRLECFFLLEHPLLWEVRREMGLQMMRIGAARTAASIFIEHKMWDELGMCCDIANDPAIALDVLDKEEATPLVLTVMGEQRKDIPTLERAWELSEHRFSRAQRSIARLLLKEEKWAEAAEHFEMALKLNTLYPASWFSLGCCHMRLENFDKAIAAFQEVVAQKGDDSESFSNLAICFTTVGKHLEAHKAVTQAVRFNRQNPKIWENFIVIALNADILKDAIFGIEELNRVHPKWCNVQLMYEVESALVEKKGDLKRFVQALDKVSQTADCGFDFWTVFADLVEAAEDYQSAYEMRNNAVKDLEKEEKIREVDVFGRLVNCVEKLVKTAAKAGKERAARSRVRVTMKKYMDDFGTTEQFKRLEALAE